VKTSNRIADTVSQDIISWHLTDVSTQEEVFSKKAVEYCNV